MLNFTSRRVWSAIAMLMILRLSRTQAFLTSDEVWAMLKTYPVPGDPRQLGTVFQTAARRGFITKTQITQPSKGRKNHKRPIAVWKSNRFTN